MSALWDATFNGVDLLALYALSLIWLAYEALVSRLCGICGGEGRVLIVTDDGPNGDHYEPSPCPQCGDHTDRTDQ